MSVLQIEGWDSLTTPLDVDELVTKFHVTNPSAPDPTIGVQLSVQPGRTGNCLQSGADAIAVLEVHPTLRAGGTFSDTMIVGFAHRVTAITSGGGGNFKIPVVRIMLDSGEGMELTYSRTASLTFEWEVWRGYAPSPSVAPGTGTLLGTSGANPYATNTWAYIEFRFLSADSGGIGELRINGTPVVTFSGDTKLGTGSPTYLKHYIHALVGNTVQYDDMYWLIEDGVGRNTWLGDVFVETIRPNADGNQNDWTRSSGANNYEMVDEIGFDGDGTYVSTNTVDDVDLYEFENLTLITTETILALQVATVDRNEAVGTNNLEHMFRSITPLEFQGAKQGLVQDTPYEGHYQIWEKDPQTGFNWSVAAINNGQFGVKLVS
jgi:hypothetical protein